MKYLIIFIFLFISCIEKHEPNRTKQQELSDWIACFTYNDVCFCKYQASYGGGFTYAPDKACKGENK